MVEVVAAAAAVVVPSMATNRSVPFAEGEEELGAQGDVGAAVLHANPQLPLDRAMKPVALCFHVYPISTL